MSALPAPRIEEREGFLIVRDDELPGGTKRRALGPLLDRGGEYVYAGPAFGYAQLALAYAARDREAFATIFVAKRAALHARTAEARKVGAQIVQVPHGYLSNVQAKAASYAVTAGATLLPFGLDTPLFRRELAAIARSLELSPAEVWTVAGSGTLTRALQEAWPKASFAAVIIGASPEVGRAEAIRAPEAFEDPAWAPPPFPSCLEYDAKAWRIMREQASPGALFWNVGA